MQRILIGMKLNYFVTSLFLILLQLKIIECQNIFILTKSAGNVKGKIVTENGKNFSVFLSIPYAKPPVDNLSFAETQPLDPINETTVIDASKNFSKVCIQLVPTSDDSQSEDCLYLNVLSPKTDNTDKTLYPVMVWIHGGAFILGSASEYPVEGTLKNLVSRGIVFVSINYRLGIFGFFSTKSQTAAGNFGLFDQVEALRWVKKNVEFFGGDPSKITIFGESAGGASVSFLTLSPSTKGLFNQAIIMSGSALSPWALTDECNPFDASDALLKSVGCRKNETKLILNVTCPCRNAANIQWNQNDLKNHEDEVKCLRSKFKEITSQDAIKFASLMRPRVDGKLIPDFPESLMKNRTPRNILLGVVENEFAIFPFIAGLPGFGEGLVLSKESFYNDSFGITCSQFKNPGLVKFASHFHYGQSLSQPTSSLDEKHFWFEQDTKVQSALGFVIPVYRDATAALNTKSQVYLYSWNYKEAKELYDNKTDFYWKGATHASELSFLFDTSKIFELPPINERRNTSQDSKAAETLGKLWTNFAKYGNPTPDKSINETIWEQYSQENLNYLSIDIPNIQTKNNFFEYDVEFWTKFIPQLQNSVQCN